MQSQHLFGFGYASPDEFRTNDRDGTDFASARDLWILASSEQEALDWGRSVAEQFVTWLFRRAGEDDYPWQRAGFGCWIETDASVVAAARTVDIPAVAIGEMPDFEVLEGPPYRPS